MERTLSLRLPFKLALLTLLVGASYATWKASTTPLVTSPILTIARAAPTSQDASSLLDVRHISLTELTQITERPVFTPERRPFKARNVKPKSVPKPVAVVITPKLAPKSRPRSTEGMALFGVFVSGETRRALLWIPGSPMAQWVDRGKTVDGWKVQSIENGSVRLDHKDQTVHLELYRKKNNSLIE